MRELIERMKAMELDGLAPEHVNVFDFLIEFAEKVADHLEPLPEKFEQSEGTYSCEACSHHFRTKGRICTALMGDDCNCPRCLGNCTCKEEE